MVHGFFPRVWSHPTPPLGRVEATKFCGHSPQPDGERPQKIAGQGFQATLATGKKMPCGHVLDLGRERG